MLEKLFSFRPLAKCFELFDYYPPFVGIDLGTSAIKLIVADRRDGRPVVQKFAVAETPQGAVVDRNIVDPDAVANVLKQMLEGSSIGSRHGVIAVGGEGVITRLLSFPEDLSPLELEDRIYEEAEQFLPFALEEVYLDYQPLGGGDILVVAARRESVDPRLAVLEEVGIEPVIVDVESYALLNSLLLASGGKASTGEHVAILDLGACETTLALFDGLKPVFQRSGKVGGQQLLKQIQEVKGFSPQEALQWQRDPSRWDETFRKEILFPFFQELLQQLQHLLQFAPTDYEWDHLVLAGGGALMPGVDQLFKKALKKEVSLLSPFERAHFSPTLDSRGLAETAPLWAMAAGLAYRYLEFDGSH